MSVQVNCFDGSAHEWDNFAATAPYATIAHAWKWAHIIDRVYGHGSTPLVARENGRITGILPLVNVCSLVFGRFMVSMPYLNAGGPVGSESALVALSEYAEALAVREKMNLLELRCRGPLPLTLEASQEKLACVLELGLPASEVWNRFSSKLRSQIRRPAKEGLVVRFGAGELEPFFRVFARNMRDLGSPPHPLRFYEEIQQAFNDAVWFGCVYLRGVPVAAGCALVWRDEIEMTWASALREYSACAPNMLLYWSFIERACDAGLMRFDFGRCTPNSGSHRFKRQWGARDVPLFWYRGAASRAKRPPSQQDGSLSLASRLWKRIPTPVATTIGTHLRGGIPS